MVEIKLHQYNYGVASKKTPSKNIRKGHGFSTKCASLVKQQRARIYILRRCATMLLCWYIHGDE